MASDFISPNLVSPSAYVINQYTLGQICTRAYRLAGGLILAGQGINGSEQAEILDIVNDMVDGQKLEAYFQQFVIRTVVAVAAGKRVYSVGPGGDWDIERPEKINNAGFIVEYQQGQSEAEISMFVVISYEQWAQLVAKKTTSSIPLVLYYQATTANGYGSATVWPVPQYDSSSNESAYIALYTPGYLQEFTSLDDPFLTPKGFREFFVYELATKIHERPPYSKQPMPPSVTARAIEYKDRIKYTFLTPILAVPDQAACSHDGRGGAAQPVRAWNPYS